MAKPHRPTTVAEAAQAVRAVFERNPKANLQGANEAATRLLLIDEVLIAMGWGKKEFCPETYTYAGDFTDYVLTNSGERWMVVEAKRVGTGFDLPLPSGGKANSSLRTLATLFDKGSNSLQEAIKQSTRYCNDHAVPHACVTNGYQWFFFRGLSREKIPWRSGAALVFHSPDEVGRRFDEFWHALGRECANTSRLPAILQARTESASTRGERPIESLQVYRPESEGERVAYIRMACSAFLGDLYGEGAQELLKRCYVEPTTEGDFERSLRRLLKDNAATVEGVTQEGDVRKFIDEIQQTDELGMSSASNRHPIIVVGHVGAGKTTFIHRALAQLRLNSSAFHAVVNLDQQVPAGGFDAIAEQRRVAEVILGKLGRAACTTLRRAKVKDAQIERCDPNKRETLERLYGLELQRERSLAGDLSSRDPDAWSKREYELLSERARDHLDTLGRYVRYLRQSCRVGGQNLPVLIVLDNVDTTSDEYQRLMFGLAQTLAGCGALVVLCLREDTYVRGRESGGFLTSSLLPYVFHVRSPPFDVLLRARVRFARQNLKAVGVAPAQIQRALKKAEQLVEFLRALEEVLTPPQSAALEIVAALAGHNMRDGLGLVRSVLIGDLACRKRRASTAAYALECLFAGRNFTERTSELNLANVLDAEPADPPAHGLRLRLLAYFWWTHDSTNARSLNERTETVISRFSSLGYGTGEVERALRDLLRLRTLISADRSEARTAQGEEHELPVRLSLTASGLVHIRSLHKLDMYRAAMAMTTRWYTPTALHEFISQASASAGDRGLSIADIAEGPALKVFNAYLASSWAAEEQLLASPIRKQNVWAREVEARVDLGIRAEVAPLGTEAGKQTRRRPARKEGQLGIFVEPQPAKTLNLRPLPAGFEHEGSQWLPRILWALEFAARMGWGPQSATDLARILNEHGEQRVFANNVARAFREYKSSAQHQHFWLQTGKCYSISVPGRTALEAALAKLEFS